jgi:tripartite-type tricarboxylate transporter receptor subunit TctC
MIGLARVLLLALLALPAAAQTHADYPARPIRIVVPYSAGGGSDLIARLVGEELGARLGQRVTVENRAGAGGIIGMQAVAAAERDGYTLGLVTPIFVIAPLLAKTPPYRATQDFTAVGMIGFTPLVLAVHPEVPARNVQELIDLARAKPGGLNFATLGASSTQSLAAVLFNHTAGFSAVEVPYKGSAPAISDLLGGNVQYMFNALPSMLPLVRAGKLRALGVTSVNGSPLLPDVPTIRYTLPGYQVTTWYALVAPAGTPRDAILRINRELAAILATRDVYERLQSLGLEPDALTIEELNTRLNLESARWARLIRDAKIPPQAP